MLNYKKEKVELSIPDGIIEEINHTSLRNYQVNQDLYDGTKRYLKDLTELQMNLLYSNDRFMELMNSFDYLNIPK